MQNTKQKQEQWRHEFDSSLYFYKENKTWGIVMCQFCGTLLFLREMPAQICGYSEQVIEWKNLQHKKKNFK